ncbi:DUF2514 family protein [Psychrobacter sp. KCTC 72983]|uniref:DUF2514 family protein n=1 Tax=Psychrobacter sp. KCTC 72983 TaxID=2733866 RepID=UPI0016491117|nr:DUF2514 family protein [Psychrobacter sp. KCTC 72983]
MNAILLAKFWREIVIFVLSSLFVFALFSVYTLVQSIEHIKTEHELTLTTERAAYEVRARKIERQSHEQVIQAINDSQAREAAIAVDVANTNRANERLHQTVDRLNTSIARENSAARADYAATLSILFKESTARYIELAKAADGHVNDIRTLQDANANK